MKFEINRKLENNIFSTRIAFKEYGGKTLEAEEEKELINDFGAPKINLADIDFTGSVSKDEDGKLKVTEDGEEISFILNAKTLVVDNKFSVDLKVNPDKLDFVTISKKDEVIDVDEDNEKPSTIIPETEEESEEEILAPETRSLKLDKDSVLSDKRIVAESVCLIFEDKIKEAIEEELEKLRDLFTSFEKETPIEFTI